MAAPWALALNKDHPDQARLVPLDLPPLAPGQARLAIGRFALTANNATYATFGRAMRYWDFFPAVDGSGRLPVWGFATVTDSRAEGLGPGARVWGFLPAASHLTVTPADPQPRGFSDAAPHRADLPAVYNHYAIDRIPDTPGRETARALFEPQFLTAVLLALHLRRTAEGAQAIAITSASSKTALALAALLRADPIPGVAIEGLTAPANLGFVAGSGLYDRTAAYDDLSALPDTIPRLIVDIAGSAPVNRALHARLGDRLTGNIRVGGAHRADSAPAADLPGPRPRFFFAPDALRTVRADMGAQALADRIAAGREAVARMAEALITPRRLHGPEGALQGWQALLANTVPPDTGLIVDL